MISSVHPDYSYTPAQSKITFQYRSEKSETPEISIVTPFFNTGKIFVDTFRCIINQSFQNFEWLIVNDCSTDSESITLLEKLAAKDARVKIINNPSNQGPGGSRNTGIAAARGNFIFFVDSDDLVELTMMEKCWLFLQMNNQFAFCNSWHVGFDAETYLWKKGFETGKQMLEENVIQPTFLARKELFRGVLFDETIRQGFEDWDFWMRCASSGYWGYTIPEFLYWYRRTGSIVQKWASWDFGEKMQLFKDQLKEKYGDYFRAYFPDPQVEHFTRGVQVQNKFQTGKPINVLKRSDKKRLMIFLPWMSMGGADKFNLDLIEGLSRKKWEITIVATQKSDNSWYHEFSKFTQDIFVLHNYSGEADFVSQVSYLISSRRPDHILITNSEYAYYLVPYLKMTFPEIPLVDYNHMEELYWNNGGHPRQGVIYQPHLQKNIVSSKHLKTWMVKEGADEDKIEVVSTNSNFKKHGPSNEVRKKIRDKFGVDDHLCIITFSGRLTAQKQPNVLIRTIYQLGKLITDGYVLAIAGDGPDLENAKELVRTYGLGEKVWFLGSIPNADNIELLQASDIFFLPSLWEGISLAIYEAMTVGLPIVGANVGGQKELVIPKTGFLVERSNEETESYAYARVLARLINNPDLRKKMGKDARVRIEQQFSIEQMWNKMDRILSNLKPEENTNPQDIRNSMMQLYALMMHDKKVADQLWSDILFLRDRIPGDERTHQNPDVDQQLREYKEKIKEISNWYQKEYEVLPLWYKRVGHVIKVLKGQRSINSLISKNTPNQ